MRHGIPIDSLVGELLAEAEHRAISSITDRFGDYDPRDMDHVMDQLDQLIHEITDAGDVASAFVDAAWPASGVS